MGIAVVFRSINVFLMDVIGVVSMCAIGDTSSDVLTFASGVGPPSTTWIVLMDASTSSAQLNAGAALYTESLSALCVSAHAVFDILPFL
jgi:hypothetical protein